jgi:hypothetical protein
MKNPWYDTDAAYEPMFDEHASIETPDGRKNTFEVAVFTDGTGDPLTDGMLDSEREDVMFVFKKSDWPFVKGLTRGATLTRPERNKTYAVSEAKYDSCFGWVVTAREK